MKDIIVRIADMTESTQTSSTFEDESFILWGKDVTDILGLECGVCKERYDLGKRQAKCLQCKHTICLSCLQTIFAGSRKGNASKFSYNGRKCPICQCDCQYSSASDVPNDHRIVKGLDSISKAEEKCKNKCFKHDYQNLESFCETCALPVCVDCIALHHKEDSGHKIIDLTTALNEIYTRFDEREKKCTASLRVLSSKQDVIENIKINLDNQETKEINTIKKRFAGYITILNNRQEELVNVVTEYINKRKSEINTEAFHLEESRKELRALYDGFKDSRESGDVRVIFKSWKKFIEQKDINETCFSEEEHSRTVEFTALNEERLKTALKSVGDVQTKVDLKIQLPS